MSSNAGPPRSRSGRSDDARPASRRAAGARSAETRGSAPDQAPIVGVIVPAFDGGAVRSGELDALFAQLAYLDSQANPRPPVPPELVIDETWGETNRPVVATVAKRRSLLRRAVSFVLRTALTLALAMGLAFVVQRWVVQPYKIPSASMAPTLVSGDRILVNRLAYRLGEISYGDVVVFERPDPGTALDGGVGLPPDLVKRVIGLPGDSLESRQGIVYRNGAPIDEAYLDGRVTLRLPLTIVPDDEIFVMGDNRGLSRDSRFFGTIPKSHVLGKVIARYWPTGHVGRVR